MRAGWLMLVVVTMPGCVGPPSATRGIEEPQRMVEAVVGKVPIGTSIKEAQRFMESEGFDCKLRTRAEFLDRSQIDYLDCNRDEGDLVKRRWQVALVHRDGKLVEVLSSTGLIGP